MPRSCDWLNLKSVSVKFFCQIHRRNLSVHQAAELWLMRETMCLEQCVDSATPNLVLMAWDGFPSRFLTFFSPSVFFFSHFHGWRSAFYINHRGFVPVFINQIIWCHTHLSSWKVCTELHAAISWLWKEKIIFISSNTTQMVIEIKIQWCF